MKTDCNILTALVKEWILRKDDDRRLVVDRLKCRILLFKSHLYLQHHQVKSLLQSVADRRDSASVQLLKATTSCSLLP